MPIEIETWGCEFCMSPVQYTGNNFQVEAHEKRRHFPEYCKEKAKELVIRLESMGANPNDKRTQAIVIGALGQYPLTLKIAIAIWDKKHPKKITSGYNKDKQDSNEDEV